MSIFIWTKNHANRNTPVDLFIIIWKNMKNLRMWRITCLSHFYQTRGVTFDSPLQLQAGTWGYSLPTLYPWITHRLQASNKVWLKRKSLLVPFVFVVRLLVLLRANYPNHSIRVQRCTPVGSGKTNLQKVALQT